MFRTVFACAVVLGGISFGPAAALAAPHPSAVQTVHVAGTTITLEVPAHWVAVDAAKLRCRRCLRDWLKQYPNFAPAFGMTNEEYVEQSMKDWTLPALMTADMSPGGAASGDNLFANVGTDGDVFVSLAEWKAWQKGDLGDGYSASKKVDVAPAQAEHLAEAEP